MAYTRLSWSPKQVQTKPTKLCVISVTNSTSTRVMTIQYLHSNGSHAWSPSPMGNTEGLVQVGVHNISAIICWSTKSNLLGKMTATVVNLSEMDTRGIQIVFERRPAQRGNEDNDLMYRKDQLPFNSIQFNSIYLPLTKKYNINTL